MAYLRPLYPKGVWKGLVFDLLVAEDTALKFPMLQVSGCIEVYALRYPGRRVFLCRTVPKKGVIALEDAPSVRMHL